MEQNNARVLLKAGAWFWPREEDEAPLERARALMPQGPPEVRPGQIPLLAYRGGGTSPAEGRTAGGSVWLLEPQVEGQKGHVRNFMAQALASWQEAQAAVARSALILWRSPQVIAAQRPQARFVERTHDLPPAEALDGASYGLAFAISIYSRAIDVAVPVGVAATATLDGLGRPGRVEGLLEKVRALVHFAPRVQELYIARGQFEREEDRAAVAAVAGERLRLVEVGSLAEALGRIFPSLPDDWVALGQQQNVKERAERVERLFQLAAGRSDILLDWQAVETAADKALKTWEKLSEEENRCLRFTHAIACRHQNNGGHFEMPDPGWLQQLAQPLRTDVLSHLVQQAADSGAPDPDGVWELAHTYLQRAADAFPAHLKLLGALGRLAYARGEHRLALEMQLEAMQGWFVRDEVGEVSFPLSFGYVVAGGLGCRESLARLETCFDRWRQVSGSNPAGASFVNYARGRARALCGDYAGALEILTPLAEQRAAHDHLRQGAWRWQAFCLAASGPEDALLHRSSPADLLQDGVRALVAMDRALRAADAAAADQHAREFIAAQPEPITTMLARRGDDGYSRAEFIQRFYPYY